MKRIFLEHSQDSDIHVKFATGLKGEEVKTYFDEESDYISSVSGHEPVYCEMDVSSMDACRNY